MGGYKIIEVSQRPRKSYSRSFSLFASCSLVPSCCDELLGCLCLSCVLSHSPHFLLRPIGRRRAQKAPSQAGLRALPSLACSLLASLLVVGCERELARASSQVARESPFVVVAAPCSPARLLRAWFLSGGDHRKGGLLGEQGGTGKDEGKREPIEMRADKSIYGS